MEQIIISKQTWDELYHNEFYREVLDMIEDIELFNQAKSETREYVDLDEYHKLRMSKLDVSN